MLKDIRTFYHPSVVTVLHIKGYVAVEAKFEGDRPDGPYLVRSRGRTSRGTGPTYILLSGKDWDTTGRRSKFKATSDTEAIEIANKRLEQWKKTIVCDVVKFGHCDQCDHPCKEYFER